MNRTTAFIFALILAASLAFSAPIKPPPFSANYGWDFQLSTAQGSLPADSMIYVEYSGTDGKNGSTYIVSKDGGTATLYTENISTGAYLLYDDPATPAPDAEWQGSLQAAQPIVARLSPIAEVGGTALTSDGQPAAGALVELSCPQFAANATASETGGFKFERVPAAKCLLLASLGGESARSELALSQGDFSLNELRLGKEIPLVWIIAVLAVLIAAAAGVLWLAYGKKPKGPAPSGKIGRQSRMAKPVASGPTKRQSDLLATLDPLEKKIVEYVMHYAPASVKMPKIRRDLLIPKTSLTRTLQALERKQFLKIEKLGSRMYVKLNDFFRNG